MKLRRSREHCMIAGVCGGLAGGFGLSPERLRVVWILATIFTAFAGVILYLALWYLIPLESYGAPAFETPPMQPWKKSAPL